MGGRKANGVPRRQPRRPFSKRKFVEPSMNVRPTAIEENGSVENHSVESDNSIQSSGSLNSTNFGDNLNILFSNIDGIRAKWSQLRSVSQHDHILCLNELNLAQSDTSLLTAKYDLGDTASIKSLDRVTYNKKGLRTPPKKKVSINGRDAWVPCTKKKGFGTAIVSKIPNLTRIQNYEGPYELVYATMKLNNLSGVVITGYRSPSSRCETEISGFYTAIDSIVTNTLAADNHDFVIFVGDDNASLASTSHYSRFAASQMLKVAEKFQMVDLIENINTRGDRQPDSCFAFFDAEKVEIEASALNGIVKSDHELLQISIRKSQIVAEIPKFKKIRKRVQCVSDENLNELLEDKFAAWYDKWYPKLNMADSAITDKAANAFVEVMHSVQSKCFKKRYKRVPARTRRLDTDLDIQILQIRAKISRLAFQIRRDSGQNLSARKKMLNLNTELKKVVHKAAKKLFQQDMATQENLERKNDTKFWDLTGAFLNKSAYQTSIDRDMTRDQISEKLDSVDKTFVNSDPDYTPDPECYTDIPEPPKKYNLNTDPELLITRIKSISRIQPFIKRNAETLATPICLLLKLIQKTDYFPSVFKTSRCSIIGKPPKERAIFALAPIPKILETIIKDAFDELKTEDGTFQMAYTKNRGTTSCNVITLQEVEMSDEPCLQTQQDLVKAFNSTKHETIIEQAQAKFGAGKLISSWITNRTYTFESPLLTETRGYDFNQGVPAGTLIGVECFLLFIATALKLTNKNTMLLWAALYADDTSPLVKSSNLVEFQEALDFSIDWARKNRINFHLTGSKAPTFLAYLKSDQVLPDSVASLNLAGIPIKRIDSDTVLGLRRNVRPIDPNTPISKTINKYGYECSWDLNKLKQIAYRFQHLRHDIVPEFMRKLVSSYFVGYLRFSSAVIYSRSSKSHINTARYYYCMAMAAALGLSTAEALNLSCCKHLAVKEDNRSYKLLLAQTGLPSIREMAALDSCSAIKQVSLIRPHWFIRSAPRVSRSKSDGTPKIVGVVKNCRGTLIHDLLILRDLYSEKYAPVRNELRKRKESIRNEYILKISNIPNGPSMNKEKHRLYCERKAMIARVDAPCVADFHLAKEQCTVKGSVDFWLAIRTFTLNSRFTFNCLDTRERCLNMKTPLKSLPSTTDTPSATETPRRNNTRQNEPARKRLRAVLGCDKWIGSKAYCRFCKELLDTDRENRKRKNFESHLLYFCKGIPGLGPLPRNNRVRPKDRMRRLAEISAVPDPGG